MVERIFKATDRNGSLCDFELKPPGLAEENEGERQYRIAYSKALVEGIFPREKLREIMRNHGMWTEDDDKELKKAVGKIAVYQVELRRAEAEGQDEACLKAAKGISDARRRMWELFLVQQSVYMNSAEGIAEMIKTESIMSACTLLKATGQRYWKDYAEYVRERDLNNKSTVYANVIEVQTKILDDARQGLMSDYPEYRYLKTVEERVIDREVEEEVTRQIKARVEKAIDAGKEPEVKKKVRKRGKRVATKSDSTK
jgi:hypothetical protein